MNKEELVHEVIVLLVVIGVSVWVLNDVMTMPITLQNIKCLDCEPPIDIGNVVFVVGVALIVGTVVAVIVTPFEVGEEHGGRQRRT